MKIGILGSSDVAKSVTTACLAFLLLAGCNGSSPTESASDNYRVRVINERADTIAVIIGPADYGTIAPGDTTMYMKVHEGDNVVLLNGEVAAGSPAHFGTGSSIACRWTYEFEEFGYGFGWDGCD
jgi:hypothetical protein